MVILKSNKKTKLFISKKAKLAVVALVAIAVLFSASISFAKFELNKLELAFIREKLDIVAVPELSQLSDKKLAELLGIEIDPASLSGLTYGAYSLLVFQEIEFIDWIVSQDYKREFRNYFESIVNRRARIDLHWRDVGRDVPVILGGKIIGPISALSLNTFSITNNVLGIGRVVLRIAGQKVCDGLWEYLDERRRGSSHKEAWYWSKIRMGWMPRNKDYQKYSWVRGIDKGVNQFEPWFAQLWDKWGSHITLTGISEEYKKQVRSELKDVLAVTLKQHKFVEKKPEPWLIERVVREIGGVAQTASGMVQNTWSNIQNTAQKYNPFKAVVAPTPKLSRIEPEPKPKDTQVAPVQFVQVRKERLAEAQEMLDDMVERVDVLIQKTEELVVQKLAREKQEQEKQEQEETEEDVDEELIEGEEDEDEEEDKEEIKKEDVKEIAHNPCADGGKIDINTASFEDLDFLTGIGPDRAQRIIDARLFNSLDELIRVKNIGPKILQDIKNQGCAYVKRIISRGSGGGGGWTPPPPPPVEPIFCSQENLSKPTHSPIIFNEIAWMGTNIHHTNEWIELKNISGDEIDLAGWQILDKDGQIKIIFNNGYRISINEFLLLERDNDDTVPNIQADKTYTGNLRNRDESLRLFDQNCNLIDEVLANIGENLDWPAGSKDKNERRSMERSQDLTSWQTYYDSGTNGIMGTPKAENSQPPEEEPSPEEELPPEDTSPPVRDNGQPAEDLGSGTFQTNIILVTDEAAFCRYSRTPGQDYDSMTNLFSSTDQISHSTLITDLSDGSSYSFYVRCADALENKNADDFIISFNIASPPPEQTPTLTVVINEIAWMGTEAHHTDEWIELYNATDSSILLDGWLLKAVDGIPEIELSGEILPQGFFLLERTDDNTTSEPADLIYGNDGHKWALHNDGEILELWGKDKQGELVLIDKVGCIKKDDGSYKEWFVGDNTTKQTMERINSQELGENPQNWRTHNKIFVDSHDAGQNPIFGTPKAKNSVSYQLPITLPNNFGWDLTLAKQYSPYLVYGFTTISQNSILTIEPGVILKFIPVPSGNASQFHILGTIKAIGTPEDKIIFTSIKDDEYGGDTNNDGPSSGSLGDWRWFCFGNDSGSIASTESELENVLIRYAETAIVVKKGSSIALKHSRLENNKRGVELISSPNTIISNTEFINHSHQHHGGHALIIRGAINEQKPASIIDNVFKRNSRPIHISKESDPIVQGNTGSNNDYNGIIISPSGSPFLRANMIWENNPGFPYIIHGSFSLLPNITLKIESGTVIKLQDKNNTLSIYGNLIANGKESNQIIFTSLYDDEYGGDTNNDGTLSLPDYWPWKEITFGPEASGSLKWVIIRYGGLVIDGGADVSQKNVTIE